MDDIPEFVSKMLANSIKPTVSREIKLNNIGVVYTRQANLKKTQGWDVGQVGFYKKEVRKGEGGEAHQ